MTLQNYDRGVTGLLHACYNDVTIARNDKKTTSEGWRGDKEVGNVATHDAQ